jgi:hypothetical protein
VQTERDAEIVDWIGRLGAAGAEHVMERFGMGRSWAYSRLRCLVRDELLEQHRLLHRRPGLYIATAEGLRWRVLRRLGTYRLGPAAFEHARQVAALAACLHADFGGWHILSERELRVEEADAGRPLASAKLGELPGGRPALSSA